jgi:acyl-coenzyme A thioesterase PaaI-like protein
VQQVRRWRFGGTRGLAGHRNIHLRRLTILTAPTASVVARKFSLLPWQVLARELWTENRRSDMAIAKMSAAELEKFLDVEYPQIFSGGDISIESADGASCLLRQRYSDQMLRPGGTVSGPTLMALADFAMYVVLNINFLRKGQPGQDVLAAARLLKLGKRLAVGEVSLLSGTSPDPIAHVTATYSIPNA